MADGTRSVKRRSGGEGGEGRRGESAAGAVTAALDAANGGDTSDILSSLVCEAQWFDLEQCTTEELLRVKVV